MSALQKLLIVTLLFCNCCRTIWLDLHYHFLTCLYIFNSWQTFWLFY